MDIDASFGRWLKQRRKALDLTQEQLARQVGCAADTLRKIEADRLRPSRQTAERLADFVAIPPQERALFIQLARAGARDTLAAADRARAGRSPYVGLNTFQEADADLFFGRETLVDTLVNQAGHSSFLAVLGPSGSGKSSVVLAGLLPRLKQGAAPDSATWRYLTIRPGPRPLDTLAAALAESQLLDGRALVEPAELHSAICGMHTRLALVVDQFEELWTQAPAEPAQREAFVEEQQRPFTQLLLAVAAAPERPVLVIMTMRADFLHRAAEHGELARCIGENDLIVSPMSPDELRRAIELPAGSAGRFEPGLVDELITQVHGRPGALPLLEYTLQELWRARRADGTMTWSAFHHLGGVEGALAARADAILAAHYTLEQQDELRQILIRLVLPGDGAADTRRRALLDDLTPVDGVPDDVQALLQPLIDERLVVVTAIEEEAGERPTTDEPSPNPYLPTVEVAHEALISAWPTLERWVDEARDDLRLQLQVEEAAREWQASVEDSAFLWSGLRLDRAEAWIARAHPRLNQREQFFLQTSHDQECARAAAAEAARNEREQLLIERAVEQHNVSRLRRFLAAVGVLLLIAIGLALFAANRGQAALRAQDEAQRARSQAEAAAGALQSFAHAGEAMFELDRKPERALLLALAAIPTDTERYEPLIARALYQAFEGALIRRTLDDHAGALRAVAWRPDSRQVATAGDDAAVRIWDVATGRVALRLAGHQGGVRAVAWSPDGRQILTGGADNKAHVWDTSRGAELYTLAGHTSWVSALGWSPDGRQIVTGSYDGSVRIWAATAGAQARMLASDVGPLRAVAWRPDGRQILAGGDNGTLHVWDATTGDEIWVLDAQAGSVTTAVWSPDSSRILIGGDDGTAQIWDAATGAPLHLLKGHLGAVWSVVWSPDGRQVLTGSFDGSARLWDVGTETTWHVLHGHAGKVWAVAWSPDGRQVLSGSDDGAARLWEITSGRGAQPLNGSLESARTIKWSADGRLVLSGHDDGTALVWDVASGSVAHTLTDTPSGIRWLSWSPDGRQALAGSDDGSTRLWDIANGRLLRLLDPALGSVRAMAWSPEARYVMRWGADESAQILDITTGAIVHTLSGQTGVIRSVAWSPDGQQIVMGAEDGTVRIWSATTGTAVRALAGHTNIVRATAWSPDGRQLLTGGDDGTARLWDAASGASLLTLEGHTGSVMAAAWSPDGRQLLTGGDDGTARLWDAASGAPLLTLDGHAGSVVWMTWSADGRQVLTGSDGVTYTWLVSKQLIVADMTRRLCDLFTDAEIHATMPRWRGCAAELSAVATDLAAYDRLQNHK
jgi:WD40 repeat protein/transcriptional regulator with XRE-family HTH domain